MFLLIAFLQAGTSPAAVSVKPSAKCTKIVFGNIPLAFWEIQLSNVCKVLQDPEEHKTDLKKEFSIIVSKNIIWGICFTILCYLSDNFSQILVSIDTV